MDGFESIAYPITTLTQKYKKFEWSEVCQKSFQMYKDRLTSTFVLTLLEGTKSFGLYCDAYCVGPGCVLMQHVNVLSYAFRQLKVHERNYSTHDLQLATIVFSMKIWSYYMNGVHVNVFTDHKSLQYMFTTKEMNL